jgi:hypothetical protein
MPLQGNLKNFSTTQLLNLINLAKKSGTLTIFEGIPTGKEDAMKEPLMAPGAERAQIAFKSGKLIFASMQGQDGSLISVLNKSGKLTDDQARIMRERTKNSTDKALALLLINANYITQADVVSSVQQHTLDVVYNLMTWEQGPFKFEDNQAPSGDRIMVPIELENVIIEGSRRIREADELTKHLPDLDKALKFPENPKEKFKGVNLSVEEWRVVSFINPKNTIRQIAKTNNMSELEIRRIVYGLEQAGLVEVVSMVGADGKPVAPKPAPGAAKRPQAKPAQVQKDVVNKLIDRLRAL